jgi:hypothetical protein
MNQIRATVQCKEPIQKFLNLTGTGATQPSYLARAKSRWVPIHMAAILLLDLAFL